MPTSVTTRRAVGADLAAIRAILAAHGDDGLLAPGTADVVGPYLAHLLARHTVLVADEAGIVIAFGAVLDTGSSAQLADLFVRPDRLGQGLGGRLLAALFGDVPRRTTFSSRDPRALPLYVRAGMAPLWPNLYLEGSAARLPTPGPSVAVRAAEPGETAAIERAWTGADRAADHRFWASQADADTFIVADDGEPVAIGFGRSRQGSAGRAVDRLVVRPGVDPIGPTLAGLGRAGRGGPVQACVPGPNPILPVLLGAGFRVVDQDQFMASRPDLVDPARLLPNPGML